MFVLFMFVYECLFMFVYFIFCQKIELGMAYWRAGEVGKGLKKLTGIEKVKFFILFIFLCFFFFSSILQLLLMINSNFMDSVFVNVLSVAMFQC